MLESMAVQQRAAALPPRIPREAIVSLLVIAAIWEALSYLAPTIGVPQLAFPSFVRIAKSLTQITLADVAVTLLRVVAGLVVPCGPIFFVDTLDSMHSTSKELRDMMKSFRPTLWQFFTKLMLPASMPSIITSWKINLSLAIRVVTIAELVGAVTGIGHQLAIAQELFSVADVFAWTLTLVVILFVLEALLCRFETRVLRWRQ